MYNVKNRSASIVVYTIPDSNIRREFMPGEVKSISKDELDQLSYQPGGRELMAGFLQIQSAEALEDLNIPVEPEYYMNEQQVADLVRIGDYDAFLDCLDFAPTGVMDLIKRFAVEIPMTDTRKIAALKEKTGFDVAKALEMQRLDKEDEAPAAPAKKERRVQPAKEEGAPQRRVQPTQQEFTPEPEEEVQKEEAPEAKALPKYKVVEK